MLKLPNISIDSAAQLKGVATVPVLTSAARMGEAKKLIRGKTFNGDIEVARSNGPFEKY
ncbi:MAG: hypothetical protein SFV54_17520 [Bryobacteraceae bacterium]|nr:hypothetical protein [Bryobacteraceae bacterium]